MFYVSFLFGIYCFQLCGIKAVSELGIRCVLMELNTAKAGDYKHLKCNLYGQHKKEISKAKLVEPVIYQIKFPKK